ncbi:MAG TPA: hypothetical protein PK179_03910 [Spirochaetales bacterium]|nr:hypothetical protein [Spirochaetales bacterium]
MGAGQAFGGVMGQAASTAADGTHIAATGLMAKTGIGGVMARSVWSGMQTLTTSTLSSGINAVYWGENGLDFNDDAFASGIKGGFVSAATGMASSITSGSLGQWNLQDGNGIGLSSKIFTTEDIGRFNEFAGGLAGQGLNYALTGETTFNLANFDMFGMQGVNGNRVSSGLLELHLGKNGMSMNLGTGGMDASIGAIAASLSGLSETAKIGRSKIAAIFGQQEGLSTLNAVNLLGYTNDGFDEDLGRSIWSGRIRARYGDTGSDWGRYDSEAPDSILLSDRLLGGGTEEAAKLATVMAHEGTHAAGNRYEALAHAQGLGTYQSLVASFGLDGDEAFSQGMVAALMDERSYTANTGTVDHWIVRLDGSLYDDGNPDVVFEDGRETIKGTGKQSVLQEWLRGDDSTFNAFTSLMKGAGYDGKDISTWSGMKGTSISRSQIDEAYREGKITEAQYRAIVGEKRSDYDYARQEQKIQRDFNTKKRLEARLASLIESNLPVPEEIIMGSGKPGDPKAYTGQGGLSQLDLASALKYQEVGPCYLSSNCMPYLLMGASQDKIIKAIDKIDTKGMLDTGTAGFLKDSPVFWEAMQKEMNLPGIPSWYGSARQDMDWTAFVGSGATMGMLWMDNPNRVDPESQHWGYVYKAGDSWYFQDPYNKSSGGIFSTWGVTTWEEILDYKIRPIKITTP